MGCFHRAPICVRISCWLGGLNLCETTAWWCNWKQGPPAESSAASVLPYLPNYGLLDINSQILADPSRWKKLLSELKNDTDLPKIPWIFWEEGASTHLQERRTITPPKTRSSPARKGEPGRAEQTPLQGWRSCRNDRWHACFIHHNTEYTWMGMRQNAVLLL